METVGDKWIMHGVPDSDPKCIHNFDELVAFIDKVGFMPLFENEIKGFSIEEHANPDFWWSENQERDPWEWRILAARSRRLVYGKFFKGKAGFISLDWLPVFANARRDGYDFDALWDDEKASRRQKLIMDCFENEKEIFSNKLKEMAGFGPHGEKNFEGTLTSLQDKMYLVVTDFRRRINKKGQEYGWHVAVYSKPEDIWGYDLVTSAYKEEPQISQIKIEEKLKTIF
ncbi:MAG: hypothetical protein IJM53_05960 [Lachnospiraceae bacterium]|nr:hypothetical protein [Lachnospiraceae bacterium]